MECKKTVEKRAAIITKSLRLIGRAIAMRVAHDGFAVVVNFAGNTARAEKTVAKIKVADRKIHLIAQR
jgi:3-oxoacyl-[acyl-carrier protein] reductase